VEKPKAISARKFVSKLPYIGEYFQPDDRVYIKAEMDKYIKFLRSKNKKNHLTKGE